jgi:hypothetical protein
MRDELQSGLSFMREAMSHGHPSSQPPVGPNRPAAVYPSARPDCQSTTLGRVDIEGVLVAGSGSWSQVQGDQAPAGAQV